MNNSVIIIANGRSTKALADFGFQNIPSTYDTIGMGLAHRYYESIGWFPNYYGQLDYKMVKHHKQEYIDLMEHHPEVKKFFFCVQYTRKEANKIELGNDFRIIPCTHSGTGIGLANAMVTLRYERIFIIGVDGDWTWNLDTIKWMNEKDETDNRATLIDAEAHNKNYFCDYYRNGDVVSFKRGGGKTDPNDVKNHWQPLINKATALGVKMYKLSSICPMNMERPYNDVGETLRKMADV